MTYTAPTDLLKEKVILVTGAGDGIGSVAAKSFAEHGAIVILLGRTAEKLEVVYDQIVAAGHPEPAIVPMDLSQITQQDVEGLAQALDDNYGRLDGLLHNAAILGDRVPFEHYSTEQWQRVMQVNSTAVFLLTRVLMPLLQRSDAGRLLFTSSSVGAVPRAYWGAYAVSKYAMEGMAKLIADELEQTSPIRVNIVNPGATRTSMRTAAYPAEDPNSLKKPEELMPLYLYLLGPDSQKEHGRTFNAKDWVPPEQN
ncbi:MAG: YciK family oxidoreductase [Candidatus Azotimanducaceae bacterium WSBS_2022_MAG_OTU7]